DLLRLPRGPVPRPARAPFAAPDGVRGAARMIGWIATTLGGGAALFVATELGTRAWLARRGRAYGWAPFTRTRLELDTQTLPTLDPVANWAVNADGERGGALPHDWSRTLRVLVAGGSAAECYFVDQPKTWAEVLGRALSRPENLRALGVER